MEVDDDSLSCTDIDSGEEQEDFISLTDVNSDSDGDIILIGSEDSQHSYKVSDGDVILIGSEHSQQSYKVSKKLTVKPAIRQG